MHLIHKNNINSESHMIYHHMKGSNLLYKLPKKCPKLIRTECQTKKIIFLPKTKMLPSLSIKKNHKILDEVHSYYICFRNKNSLTNINTNDIRVSVL